MSSEETLLAVVDNNVGAGFEAAVGILAWNIDGKAVNVVFYYTYFSSPRQLVTKHGFDESCLACTAKSTDSENRK